MARYALKIEYDGSDYAGWQRQINAPSVQAEIERAWAARSFGAAGSIGASRTDAGVHARGQVVLLEGDKALSGESVRAALNGLLPPAVVIRQAVRLADDFEGGEERPFHPRYGARGKYYTYRLAFGRVRPALRRRDTAFAAGPLDVEALCGALELFVGERDFTALMDQGSPTKRSVRRLYRVDAELVDDEISPLLTFHIVGDGFLYHMVRILVGTAVAVGRHKLGRDDVLRHLAEKRRVGLGMTMPPEGLCLERVFYERELFGGDDVAAMHRLAGLGSGERNRGGGRTDDSETAGDAAKESERYEN